MPVLARAALHHWEEPPISGTRGSGTIFFSGCSLDCVFCQNEKISHQDFGKSVTLDRLRPGEMRSAREYMENLGLDGFTQERSSAKEEYTPPFDLTGI